MAADTPGLWNVLNGLAQKMYASITTDASGNITPQYAIRTAGAPVEVANPLPVSLQGSGAVTATLASGSTVGLADGATVGLASGSSTIVTPGAPTNSSGPIETSANAEEAAIIVPFSASRKWVHVFSRTTGNETIDLGSANVVVGGGIPISGGGGFSFVGSGAAGPIYAVTTVTSSPLSYVEG